jgi:hypothetical protein
MVADVKRDGIEFDNAKLIGHSTLEYTRTDGVRVIRFHRTDVAFHNPDGSVTVTTGGFETVTTKRRINENLPHGSIYSERGTLFFWSRGKRCPFVDGMTVNSDGKVCGIDLAEIIPWATNTRFKKPRVDHEVFTHELQVALDVAMENSVA